MNRTPTTNATTDADPSTDGVPGPSRLLNVGIVAHVDAGKTSLTEAILELGGAIDHRGSVDTGTTTTDTLAQERARGITIRAAVATFRVGDTEINLVDTPGHPDFIAEVDRSLAVLDGAVLVVSAVEGVQAQTVVLYRALARVGIPTVLFVNKVDRPGADLRRTVRQLRTDLRARVVNLGVVSDAGRPEATVHHPRRRDRADREQLCAELAEHDDSLLSAWVQGTVPSGRHLRRTLRALTRGRRVIPVLFGSARTTAGVPYLIETMVTTFPASTGPVDVPVAGQVFKVERTARGARVCSVRLRSGVLSVRDTVTVGGDRRGTVTALEVHRPGGVVASGQARAGQIARVRGLPDVRVGDWIGDRSGQQAQPRFPPPALRAIVSACDPGQRGELFTALAELADMDPLIEVQTRPDELTVHLYGAVQQEVIAETLATDYGIDVRFGPPTVICRERLVGHGRAVRRIGDPQHSFGYTLGVDVAPGPPGQGLQVEIAADRAGLPLHVYGTVDGLRSALLGYLAEPLSRGPCGWRVVDLTVTVTESGYPPAGPRAADVRRTAGIVVIEAVRRAGTVVCEPISRIVVEFPATALASVLGVLGRHGVIPEAPTVDGDGAAVGAALRTAAVDAVRRALHGVAQGRVVVSAHLDHFAPVRGGPDDPP